MHKCTIIENVNSHIKENSQLLKSCFRIKTIASQSKIHEGKGKDLNKKLIMFLMEKMKNIGRRGEKNDSDVVIQSQTSN